MSFRTVVMLAIVFVSATALAQQPPVLLQCGSRVVGNVGGCDLPVPGSCPEYRIELPRNHGIDLRVTASTFAPIVSLYRPDGTLLRQDRDSARDGIAAVSYSGGGIGGEFIATVAALDQMVADGPFTIELTCSVADPGPPTGRCTASAHTLCLANRYEILLDVTDHRTGRPGGEPRAIALNALAGYFSTPGLTGNPDNPEIFVKLVDARALNGWFWFFYGATTDLEAVLTVVDHVTGEMHFFRKPGGSFCGGNAVFNAGELP